MPFTSLIRMDAAVSGMKLQLVRMDASWAVVALNRLTRSSTTDAIVDGKSTMVEMGAMPIIKTWNSGEASEV